MTNTTQASEAVASGKDGAEGSISPDPHANRPHWGTDTGYGAGPHIWSDGNGGPPMLFKERPFKLGWEDMSETARHMFGDMAKIEDDTDNRYQACVAATMADWAEKLKPGDTNRLADGTPTYMQDDVIPIIKAFVSRVPRPGVTGSPIPPALSMPELEALDFLHIHQALPYQQTDYNNVFERIPDGFIWHPVKTLIGIRGLDHRTLYEFRAYKHFWAIHKEDHTIREFDTKDGQTFEISVIVPTDDPDDPRLVTGGFHNLMIPPEPKKLRQLLKKTNDERVQRGKPRHHPVMYVRYADNQARVVQDHINSPMVFDPDGVPHMPDINKLEYTEVEDKNKFLDIFADVSRAMMTPLPDETSFCTCKPKSDTDTKESKFAPKGLSKESSTSVPDFYTPNARDFTFVGDISKSSISGKLPIATPKTVVKRMAVNSKEQPQRIHVPEMEPNIRKPTAASAEPNTAGKQKPQLSAAELLAIDAKIKQLSIEQSNPHVRAPTSKLTTNYALQSPEISETKSKPSVTSSPKSENKQPNGKSSSKSTSSVLPKPTTKLANLAKAGLSTKPDPYLPVTVPGAFFANHLNRLFLVQNLDAKEEHTMTPMTGPGARSWINCREDYAKLAIKSKSMDQANIEHIKHNHVVSLQQTVYYYAVMTDRFKKEKLEATRPEATCLAKVALVLERGQRLIVEYATNILGQTIIYVRATGTAKEYDRSMTSNEKANVKGINNVNVTFSREEQDCYWKLVQESKEYWIHPNDCGCKVNKK